MINTDDNRCSGCGACKNICPVKAIKMVVNEEGFLYPQIDTSICINCGKCSAVCQIEKNNVIKMKRTFYAAFAANPQERAKSATAGVCASIAKYIIQAGGWFCGAAFYHGKLKHMLTNDFDFFDKYMRGSKYFQSDMDNIYPQIKEKLKNGELVVFVGTPCQVNGIKLFLNKEYENLYLIDIICHGVPSPKVFEKFATSNNLIDILKKDVSINFRDKKTGWHTSSLVIKNNDNIIYDKKIHEDPFCKAFLKDICLRKSCYMCHYTNINRVSDVMVGDFWGCPETIDDNKGLNLVSVNQRGEKLLQKINAYEKNIVLKEFPQNKVLQPQLCFPTAKHYARSRFFEELKKQDFNELVNSIFDKNKNVALLNFH